MRRSTIPAVLLAAMLLALTIPQGMAGHGDADSKTGTLSVTYEITWPLQFSDDGHNYPTEPSFPTDDGDLNLGGSNHRLPNHADIPSWSSKWPDGQNPEGILKVKVVDDVFGTDIGGFVCNDVTNSHTCDASVDGEVRSDFCDGQAQITAETDTEFDSDGEKDFGTHIFTVVHGPWTQAVFCPGSATSNPVGATSGEITYTYEYD